MTAHPLVLCQISNYLAAVKALVHVNAALNALATVLLVIGYLFVKQGRLQSHARTMMAAFGVSCLFLICYLTYHSIAGSVKFTQPGTVRTVYLTILLTHILLAVSVPFLAMATIFCGLRGTGAWGAGRWGKAARLQYMVRHRRLARWTFPIWLYVSITGVVVYVMLYHLWPPLPV